MGKKIKIIEVETGRNLLNILRDNRVFVDSCCNGKKYCGKCKIKIINPKDIIPHSIEKKYLTLNELKNGFVLACFHNIKDDMEITVTYEKTPDYFVSNDILPFSIENTKFFDKKTIINTTNISHFGFAIDIGTTTLSFALINLFNCDVVDTYNIVNPQKTYGADTITRIQYTKENKNKILTFIIKDTIQEVFYFLIKKNNLKEKNIKEITIAGNTTMIYLLIGLDPFPLSVSPFKTIDLTLMEFMYNELFIGNIHCKINILPGISAFIGSDIVSGIYATNFIKTNKNLLIIDIGTSGEMALKVNNTIFTTSTAAGPAFEGANIRCGTGSINGAINHAIWSSEHSIWNINTIGNIKPVGICGSGLIDLISWLKKLNLIDTYGTLTGEEISIYENIKIYQDDIRQIQLAKSAIISGLTVLVEDAGISFKEIDTLYIAGNFGKYINIKNALTLNLFPKELEDKVITVGNTSLAGCIKYLLESNGDKMLNEIKNISTYTTLSTNINFNNYFIDFMLF